MFADEEELPLVSVEEEPKPDEEEEEESRLVKGNVSTICRLVSCRPRGGENKMVNL